MSNVIDLEDFRPGEFLFAALAICLEVERSLVDAGVYDICHYRWVAGVPRDTSLFKLECPKCGAQNSFASVLPSEYLLFFKGEKE